METTIKRITELEEKAKKDNLIINEALSKVMKGFVFLLEEN